MTSISIVSKKGSSQVEEKHEMQALNDRFADYIGKVRFIREQANQIDSTGLMKQIKSMEEDLFKMKKMYEGEMDTLRALIEDLTKQRNKYQISCEKYQSINMDLEGKLNNSNDQVYELKDQVEKLTRQLRERDLELQNARGDLVEPRERFAQLQKDYEAIVRNLTQAQRKLDREKVARKEAEDNYESLVGKLNFTEQMSNEEAAELRDRLDTSGQEILRLESKVRQLSEADNTLHEKLRRVREAAASDLLKYQEDSETRYREALAELKAQMSIDAKNMRDLGDENGSLASLIKDLENHLEELRILFQAEQQKTGRLTDVLSLERQKAATHISGLEGKLHELQDDMIIKMNEITIAQEANVPLRQEIEAYKSLLDEEEKRVQQAINAAGPDAVRNMEQVTTLTSTKASLSSLPSILQNQTGMSTSLTTMAEKRSPNRPLSLPSKRATAAKQYVSIETEKRRTPRSAESGSSAVGNLKISEVDSEGKCIRIENTGRVNEEELGGYLLQQNVGGHPVAVFRFPAKTKIMPGQSSTVWASSSLAQPAPPTDFLHREQRNWGTGPECTTILCKPSGQAVSWTSMAQRENANRYNDEDQSNPLVTIAVNPSSDDEITVIKRQRSSPNLKPIKHPHGQSTQARTHPSSCYEPRPCYHGNDNSSLVRQTRAQTTVPDHVGEMYAGGARTQAARAATSTRGCIVRNNRATEINQFMRPSAQMATALNYINKDHNLSHNPPMPRPGIVSNAW